MNPATGLMIGTGLVLLIGAAGRLFRKPAEKMLLGPRYVLAVGDSLTANGGYCQTLEQALPLGSMVTCKGWVGQGAKAINQKISDQVLAQAQDVIVLAGVNDLASGRGVQHTVSELERIYQRARRVGARVIAVELTPWAGHVKGSSHVWDTAEVNEWIAKSPSVELVVPTGSLGDGNGFLRAEYDSGDGLHLSAEGQRQLGILIYKYAFEDQ